MGQSHSSHRPAVSCSKAHPNPGRLYMQVVPYEGYDARLSPFRSGSGQGGLLCPSGDRKAAGLRCRRVVLRVSLIGSGVKPIVGQAWAAALVRPRVAGLLSGGALRGSQRAAGAAIPAAVEARAGEAFCGLYL